MMRICLFLSVYLCLSAGLELQAQSVPTRQPAPGFRMADNSPLSRLSTKDNKVTPASFLGGTDALPPLSSSPATNRQEIPSILTGKNETPIQEKDSSEAKRKIDPLNIPSVPIGTRSGTSGDPNRQPSSFVPPTNTKPSNAQPSNAQPSNAQPTNAQPGGSFAPGSVRGTNAAQGTPATQTENSTFQSSGSASPRIEAVSPRAASSNGASSDATPRIGALQNRMSTPTPTFDQVRTAEARNSNIRSNPPAKSTQPNIFTSQKLSPQIKVVSVGPKSLSVNKSGKYEIKIANVGTIDANEVMIGIEIPAWVEIVGNPVASGGVAEAKTFEGGKGVVWSVSFLPAGRESTVAMDLMPKENRAFIS